MRFTNLELRVLRMSVEHWKPCDHLTDRSGVFHPSLALARLRSGDLFPVGPQPGLAAAAELPLCQFNAVTGAFYDLTEWLRDRDCTPGITRALLNGERNKILALIDAELNAAVTQ